jgi:branched-chain amino acid aminotransferase
MAKLQRPPYVYMNGRLTAWDDARIHVGAEALIRGISVFEGIKAYWRHDGSQLNVLAMREHYDRLVRSARLQQLPFATSYEAFKEACATLVGKLVTNERDLWMRTTLLAVEGNWGEDTVSDLVITSYHQDKKRPEPIDVGVSTWHRSADTSLPARIKSAANYQLGRLARIEGRPRGYSDMILLNSASRVAEATGSCVLLVRDGRVSTPPHYEGCLESITVNIVEGICRTLAIPFERRPIERTELLVADELWLVGTLMELARVKSVDGYALPQAAPVLSRVADEFWLCVRGEREHPLIRLTPLASRVEARPSDALVTRA